jgi:NAD(P)-dependent dehydrogenase (short-subunit alcohol dehydrogenase family)
MTTEPLAGRVVLLTGGSRGIGQETALALAELGASVAVLARDGEAAERVAEQARGRAGRPSLGLALDVAVWPAVQRTVEQVQQTLGEIDVVINNAGVLGQGGALVDLSPDEFSYTLAVNTLGPFHVMKAVLPSMLARRSGVIINVSSGAALRPRAGRVMYGTSKAALDHLTSAAADEIGRTGVRIYAFLPGAIDTDMNATWRTQVAAFAGQTPPTSPADGLMGPDKPAAVIAWLASPAGAAWTEVVLRWRDATVRERLRSLPGFPTGVLE